jgi:hypothetical protein
MQNWEVDYWPPLDDLRANLVSDVSISMVWERLY